MKQKSIPLDGYTDQVRKIITMPIVDQQSYKDMIREFNIEDIKFAINILKEHDTAKLKIKELEAELRSREMPQSEIPRDKWTNDFRNEWNRVRKIFGKL